MNMRLSLVGICLLALTLSGPIAAQERVDTTPGHQNPAVGGPKYKKDKAAKSRNVRGSVTDEAGRPMEGALVTLTDTQTKEKLTYITKQDGRYSFDDLSFTKDYELSARYKNMISTTRRLSQYDRTAEIVRVLEVAANDGPPAPEIKK